VMPPTRASTSKRNGTAAITNAQRIHGLQPDDVVFGRGQFRDHHGNLRVQVKVKEHLSEYADADASNKRKADITRLVTDSVHESGGRFLKKAEDAIDDLGGGDDGWDGSNVGGYVVVPYPMAREKIVRFLRNFQRKK